MVRRVYPRSGDISFHIPSSFILGAGCTLTVGRKHTHTVNDCWCVHISSETNGGGGEEPKPFGLACLPPLNKKVSIVPQIWAAAAEAEADPGDLILQSHRSWGPITDVRVSLLNPNQEVMFLTALRPQLRLLI